MNFKTTTLLLVALLVVGVTVIVVQMNSGKPVETPAENATKLLKLGSSDVKKVVVKPAEGKTMAFEKTGSDWRMTEPINAAANTFAVDGLVNALTGLKSRGQIEASENASVGLDKPRYTVEVTANDGKTQKVLVGKRQTVGDNLYVMLGGDTKGTVVQGDLAEQLEKPYTDFRQMKLVTANSSDIKQIEITSGDTKISLRKSGENWEMTDPQKMPVESSEASNITSALSFLNANEYVNDELPTPLDPAQNPKTTVWFSTAAPSTQPATTRPAGVTLKIGGFDSVMKKNVYVFVSDPPALAKVPASSVEAFNKKPLDLRDRKVVDIDPANVSKVTIASDLMATTQPTSRPGSQAMVTLERKKEKVEALGPMMPTTRPATQATTGPTTGPATTQVAATQPATAPALPPSKWTLNGSGEASDATVDELLGKFHPLRADKYLANVPTDAKVTARYTVHISTVAAGGASGEFEIKLAETSSDKPLIGEYNGVTFEAPHSILPALTADFVNKLKAPEAPMPSIPGLP